VIASHRGNVITVAYHRLYQELPVGKTRIVFTVETRTREHLAEMLADIRAKGFEVRTGGK
jgi:ACT domain-containing protein